MQLVILATIFTLVGAGQIKIEDDSSDKDNKVGPTDQTETTKPLPPVQRRPGIHQRTKTPRQHQRRKHIEIYKPKKSTTTKSETTTERTTKKSRNTATRRATTTTNDWISHLRNSYKVFRNAKNFDDAEMRCRQNGAHLVSIHTEPENQFVHSLTTSGHSIKNWEHFVYIGLRKDLLTNKWYWTDGSKVDFTKWAKNLPDQPAYENCTQLIQDPAPGLKLAQEWKWNDIGCHRPMKYFVCKR
ncbi:hypothetical protein Y032_0005g2377 [Ancylostoma ceylanicum]|uniref:C-type lectin domain-containing protein n=1 Tax=Ancylostoma ceylanicum TaxID=53326 RepID=A0A016VSH5_9BILA|nr:hypothetical protein Y032_0005g2377 [Ancylostoma ceylanicum]